MRAPPVVVYFEIDRYVDCWKKGEATVFRNNRFAKPDYPTLRDLLSIKMFDLDSVMNELGKWYDANRSRVAEMGIDLFPSPNPRLEFIDGEFGRYIFRFIDRGANSADIEIVDHRSGETVPHNLTNSDRSNSSIYDAAIEFIRQLY